MTDMSVNSGEQSVMVSKTSNESVKRCLQTNESSLKKRFRDNEDMDFETDLNRYYMNSSADIEDQLNGYAEEEVEEEWQEFTEYDRMLLNISNQLINFSINLVELDDWPDYVPTVPLTNTTESNDKDKDNGFPPKVGQIVFGYQLDRLVLTDKRSAIFEGHYLKSREKLRNRELIIKVGIESGFHSLQSECNVYHKLKTVKSIPKILDFIWWRVYSDDYFSVRWGMIAFEKLGPNLVQLMQRSAIGVIQPVERVFDFALQMIDILEEIHEKGYIHCALKPESFLIESEDTTNPRLKLIGLSASKPYLIKRVDGTVEHIEEQIDRKLPKGNPNFHSIGYHNGFRRSRRDDMESLGYCIVYLTKGTLPWIDLRNKDLMSAKTIRRIGRTMQTTSLEELCTGLSQQFVRYFELISEYEFKVKPNYEELRNCFRLNCQQISQT